MWDDCDVVTFRYAVHYVHHLQRLAESGGWSATMGFDEEGRYTWVRNGISTRQQAERFDDEQILPDASNEGWLVAWERSNNK
jgi:hypothetical protein